MDTTTQNKPSKTALKLFNIYLALIPTLALFLSGAIFAIHHGENWVMSLFFLVIGLLGLKLYKTASTA
jgi:hypothetical protein